MRGLDIVVMRPYPLCMPNTASLTEHFHRLTQNPAAARTARVGLPFVGVARSTRAGRVFLSRGRRPVVMEVSPLITLRRQRAHRSSHPVSTDEPCALQVARAAQRRSDVRGALQLLVLLVVTFVIACRAL